MGKLSPSDLCIEYVNSDHLRNQPSNLHSLCLHDAARWKPGQRITVKILDDCKHDRLDPLDVDHLVKNAAHTWTENANITWRFCKHGPADIRISYSPGSGSSSCLGREALQVKDNKPTMKLDIRNDDSERNITYKALHEFGHVLSFVHEHCSPETPIQWNKDAVYAAHPRQTKKWVKDNILTKFEKGIVTQYDRFDPDSIMIYPILTGWDTHGFTSTKNYTLSVADKKYVRKAYPFPAPLKARKAKERVQELMSESSSEEESRRAKKTARKKMEKKKTRKETSDSSSCTEDEIKTRHVKKTKESTGIHGKMSRRPKGAS